MDSKQNNFDTLIHEAVSSSLETLDEVFKNEDVLNFVMGVRSTEKDVKHTTSVKNIIRLKAFLAAYMCSLLRSSRDKEKASVLEHLTIMHELADGVIASTFVLAELLKKDEAKAVFPNLSEPEVHTLFGEFGSVPTPPEGGNEDDLLDASMRLKEYAKVFQKRES